MECASLECFTKEYLLILTYNKILSTYLLSSGFHLQQPISFFRRCDVSLCYRCLDSSKKIRLVIYVIDVCVLLYCVIYCVLSSYWLLATGYWLLATGYSYLVPYIYNSEVTIDSNHLIQYIFIYTQIHKYTLTL